MNAAQRKVLATALFILGAVAALFLVLVCRMLIDLGPPARWPSDWLEGLGLISFVTFVLFTAGFYVRAGGETG